MLISARADWPPDYIAKFDWRIKQLAEFRASPLTLAAAKAYYADGHEIEFVEDWIDTYDPRNAGQPGKLTTMPFIPFLRQRELMQFVLCMMQNETSGLVEKARDMGATWACVALSAVLWLLRNEIAIGWGSRKQEYVDRIGDPSSIFEKIRQTIRLIPPEFWPDNFDPAMNMSHMKIINPANGSTITGEIGDNIGRGGRTSLYFKDEAQPLTEPVLTPGGWRPMGEINAGDMVIGSTGAPVEVTAAADKGDHPCCELSFRDNDGRQSKTVASIGHLWSLETQFGQSLWRTVELYAWHKRGDRFTLPGDGRRLCDVRAVGVQPVRCISVAAADGLYITRDHIPTHNSAHYEHPDLIEASLSENTRVQIDISSVNGIGNPFFLKRQAGIEWTPGATPTRTRTNVFIMDWSDHPDKTQEWFDIKRERAIAEGVGHLFAQEIERNYTASQDGVIINQEWVKAAVDAHIKLGVEPTGKRIAGLDVAEGGRDLNALVIRKGCLIEYCDTWGERDQGITAHKALNVLREYRDRVDLWYDPIGVGSGVKVEMNRLEREGLMPENVTVHPWNAAGAVLDPKSPTIPGDLASLKNEDLYRNVKAQAWDNVGQRFFKTWQAVTKGVEISPDDIISIDSNMPNINTLMMELSQAVRKVPFNSSKMIVDKMPEGTKSPNTADAAIMSLFAANFIYTLEGVV